MGNIIKKIVSNENVEEIFKLTIESIYKNGPTSTTDLENILSRTIRTI